MVTTPNKQYQCRHCQRPFAKESTLSVHVCEPKRRFQEQSERGVQLGLQAYLKFYEFTQGSSKNKTWEDFASSSYYRAFVKFGRYCVDVRVINPTRFVEWVIKQNKKLDNWCSDKIYTEYLIDHLQTESIVDALSRAIEFGISWQESTGNPSHDCLRYGNPNTICHAVVAGRVSPWAIYNCESGQQFLGSLDAGQVAMIWPYIDSDRWQAKFCQYPEDRAYAQEILTKAGW